MADDPPRRPAPPVPRGTPGGTGSPSRPGWRVTPAPDGRGPATGNRPTSPMGQPPRWVLALLVVIALLALNVWISSQVLSPVARARIPYSPTFLQQVKSGNVQEISSTGDAIQGTLKDAIQYGNSARTTDFSTQV